jgi:hypothetical protein
MAEEEKAEEKKSQTIPVVRSEDFRYIYSNSVRIGISPWDIRLNFGALVHSENTEPINKEEVVIVMSPQHAKVLALIFLSNIQEYEETHGPISVSEAVLDRLGITLAESREPIEGLPADHHSTTLSRKIVFGADESDTPSESS